MTTRLPVLVLQNLALDGPGYLGTWLTRRGIAFHLVNTEAGQAYPQGVAGYSAVALLGGEMSANDDLASLRHAERLIVQAMDAGLPVIGHCLGGQLMARALGARVIASPAPEIGWQSIQVAESPVAQRWFGQAPERIVYQWHRESFELPRGAELLASSPACPNQAFAIGPHLAMQFHVELDSTKLAAWSAAIEPPMPAPLQPCPTVQSGAQMREQARAALPAQQRLADALYGRWLGLG